MKWGLWLPKFDQGWGKVHGRLSRNIHMNLMFLDWMFPDILIIGEKRDHVGAGDTPEHLTDVLRLFMFDHICLCWIFLVTESTNRRHFAYFSVYRRFTISEILNWVVLLYFRFYSKSYHYHKHKKTLGNLETNLKA